MDENSEGLYGDKCIGIFQDILQSSLEFEEQPLLELERAGDLLAQIYNEECMQQQLLSHDEEKKTENISRKMDSLSTNCPFLLKPTVEDISQPSGEFEQQQLLYLKKSRELLAQMYEKRELSSRDRHQVERKKPDLHQETNSLEDNPSRKIDSLSYQYLLKPTTQDISQTLLELKKQENNDEPLAQINEQESVLKEDKTEVNELHQKLIKKSALSNYYYTTKEEISLPSPAFERQRLLCLKKIVRWLEHYEKKILQQRELVSQSTAKVEEKERELNQQLIKKSTQSNSWKEEIFEASLEKERILRLKKSLQILAHYEKKLERQRDRVL